MRTLKTSFTVREADAGVGMSVHPTTGGRLTRYRYDEKTHRFLAPEVAGAWEFEAAEYSLPRISGGHPLIAGQRFPRHWRFDPFNGSELQEEEAREHALLEA